MTAERLVSMRFEKITILFFGLFLGFLFYPLLITPFPKVPLTRELKILGIEDAKDDVDAFCPPGVPVQCSGCKSLWASPPQSSSTKASHTLLCSHFPRCLLCYIFHLKLFLSLSQPPEEGRTCWRNLGKVRSEFVVEEISKWELLVSDLTGFSHMFV